MPPERGGGGGMGASVWSRDAVSRVRTKMMVWPSFSHIGKIISLSTSVFSLLVGHTCTPKRPDFRSLPGRAGCSSAVSNCRPTCRPLPHAAVNGSGWLWSHLDHQAGQGRGSPAANVQALLRDTGNLNICIQRGKALTTLYCLMTSRDSSSLGIKTLLALGTVFSAKRFTCSGPGCNSHACGTYVELPMHISLFRPSRLLQLK